MADLTIYIGNKNYSSWSLRGWLPVKESGLPFEEVLIPLHEPATRETILRYSPAGRVPALRDGGRLIWESLAIGEYMAELVPEKLLLPADRDSRALARSVIAEMHAGFGALRAHLPMNMRRSSPDRGVTPAVQADINRITAIWRDLRKRAETAAGPFLFGHFTLADAAYAPVASRFKTYHIGLDDTCQAYADAVLARPSVEEWAVAAGHEPMIMEACEV